MADAYDRRIAIGLDLFPGLGIVVAIVIRQADQFGGDTGHMRREPGLHLFQQFDGIIKTAIDQIDGLAVEGFETGRGSSALHLRRIADRIENGDLLGAARHNFIEHAHPPEVGFLIFQGSLSHFAPRIYAPAFRDRQAAVAAVAPSPAQAASRPTD